MQFHELNLLLTAYEFYQYEKKSKKTLDALEKHENGDANEEQKLDFKSQEGLLKIYRRGRDYLAYLMNTPHYELA